MAESLTWFERALLDKLGDLVKLCPEQIALLYGHFALLQKWNRTINLTSIRNPEEIVARHYCECLFFARHLGATNGASIVDIGSGAGFPGIPLAVFEPSWRITLLESHQRKAVFLREATRGWRNIDVIDERAENQAEHWDWMVARAVRPDEILGSFSKNACNVGLLVGESDFLALRERDDIDWAEPMRVPWGDRRLAVYGKFHVEPTALRRST